jgi:DNA ligase (NAD+)
MAKTAKAKTLTDVAKLTKAQAKVEHKRLSLELEAHNERYYQKDAPTVSDAAYDALRQRRAALQRCSMPFPCCRSATPSATRM